MHITADTIRSCNGLDFLDGLYLVIEVFAVYAHNLSFLEFQADKFRSFFRNLLQVSTFRKSLCRVKYFAATDGSSPQTHIVRVFQFFEVGFETVAVQIVHLILTGQCHVPGKGDDFDSRRHDKEGHIETHLVIARTGRAVRYGIGTDFLGVFGDCHCLEYALR